MQWYNCNCIQSKESQYPITNKRDKECIRFTQTLVLEMRSIIVYFLTDNKVLSGKKEIKM